MDNKIKRYSYLDFLKIMAACLVIYNHTDADGFTRWMYMEEGVEQFGYIIMSVVCKSVPIFYMISGSLLITRGGVYKKNMEIHMPFAHNCVICNIHVSGL